MLQAWGLGTKVGDVREPHAGLTVGSPCSNPGLPGFKSYILNQ